LKRTNFWLILFKHRIVFKTLFGFQGALPQFLWTARLSYHRRRASVNAS